MEHKKRISGMDAVRSVAAIIILIYHYPNHFGNYMTSVPFATILGIIYDYGLYMVEVFFAISGFVMFYNCYDKIVNKDIQFCDYILKRIYRLYPLFLITTIIVGVEQLIIWINWHSVAVHTSNDIFSFIFTIFLMNAGIITRDIGFNGPAWTIPCEILCYLLLFVLIKLVDGKNKYWVGCGALFIIMLAEFVFPQMNIALFNSITARGIKNFFVGVLLCIVYEMIYNTRFRNAFALISLGIGINTFGAILAGDENIMVSKGGGNNNICFCPQCAFVCNSY
ncbi:MAG: acyltransferase [Lachnospiraceae bacterium]|nr:acyltransferase [Lachnospiraceae bacterium]